MTDTKTTARRSPSELSYADLDALIARGRLERSQVIHAYIGSVFG